MSTAAQWSVEEYERAAQDYMRGLPLEHFMEAGAQSMQREITTESLALLRARRPDLHYFNEMLVQYWHDDKPRQVVPDTMVVLGTEPNRTRTSYALEHETAPPFLVFEYVSLNSKRKDYEDGFKKFERELKVPYCLSFHPEEQDLRVSHHDGDKYQRVTADAKGRYRIDEIDVQIGLRDGWARLWHEGELLELPAELNFRIELLTRQLEAQHEQIETQRQDIAAKEQELAALITSLRSQVETRARKAGRQDILDQLAAARDANQLMTWLAELP